MLMNTPKTVYDILQLLEDLYAIRLARYRQLSKNANNVTAQIVLDYLAKLEAHSLRAVCDEMQQLDPQRTTYMPSGPTLSREVIDTRECRCHSNSSVQDMVACALGSDRLVDELLRRLEGSSAAGSVLALARRLRELTKIKGRQISEFTRQE
ncbi:hypothetical protein Mal15_18980 [Stieleria maiorica]|uniref:Uncharacterized protein n=1 Tax=Stieleria maiorica TaxID=2795974 RepID=A0A5B9M9J3_9BACT|nr:hypothetical protein Mal15_18980 [Stieleria maiorica]